MVTKYCGRMQAEGEEISEAPAGEKVAVSITDVTIGRQLIEGDTCYSYISPHDYEKLKNSELSADDELILKELRDIRLHKNE